MFPVLSLPQFGPGNTCVIPERLFFGLGTASVLLARNGAQRKLIACANDVTMSGGLTPHSLHPVKIEDQ
jgi:hypothetical protein